MPLQDFAFEKRHRFEIVPLCLFRKNENLGIAPPVPAGEAVLARAYTKHVLTRQLVLKSISRAHPSDSDFGPSGLHVWGSYPLAGS